MPKTRTQLAAIWPPTSDLAREAGQRPRSPLRANRATRLRTASCKQASDVRHWRRSKFARKAIPGNRALAAMRPGRPSTCNTSARRNRRLSDGRAIPADVAILIIANVSVEPANDGLFPNLLAQTWRMK